MTFNPTKLIEITGISYPLIGIYDVPDSCSFQPQKKGGRCIFEHFSGWVTGESTVIDNDTAGSFTCPGAGYWMCGVETIPRKAVADYLGVSEGLKFSSHVKCRWLENTPPYTVQNNSIVISQLKDDQYKYLKTVTFFVNPDQMSLLLTGAEYFNDSPYQAPVVAPYGSGCGQLLSLFLKLDEPKAIIGATDIAMRKCLPDNILTFTVTKLMFEQLCGLDENSFLYKTFWKELKQERGSWWKGSPI